MKTDLSFLCVEFRIIDQLIDWKLNECLLLESHKACNSIAFTADNRFDGDTSFKGIGSTVELALAFLTINTFLSLVLGAGQLNALFKLTGSSHNSSLSSLTYQTEKHRAFII